jgi:hypothetical protein
MAKATLTISVRRTNERIHRNEGAGRAFSTPREYIRSFIRDNQDVAGNTELAVLIRRGVLTGTLLEAGGTTAKVD